MLKPSLCTTQSSGQETQGRTREINTLKRREHLHKALHLGRTRLQVGEVPPHCPPPLLTHLHTTSQLSTIREPTFMTTPSQQSEPPRKHPRLFFARLPYNHSRDPPPPPRAITCINNGP